MKRPNSAKPQKIKNSTLKAKIEWAILIILILLIPLAIWANLFSYTYYFFKCEDRPTEVFGNYYRIPPDKGYGIHPGSDYSNCAWAPPPGKIRDPNTIAGRANAQEPEQAKPDYDLYLPEGYEMSIVKTGGSSNMQTHFTVTSTNGIEFRVRQMNKDSDFSYTNLCSKPAEANWSGTIIGKDKQGRIICRTNPSKYIKNYIVGMNIDRTAIMLETSNGPAEKLNAEATAIFNAMKPAGAPPV